MVVDLVQWSMSSSSATDPWCLSLKGMGKGPHICWYASVKGSVVGRSWSPTSEGNIPATETGQLSRGLIVDAAIDLIDREGPEALTMQALAAEFDVARITLYSFIRGREDLLEAVVDRLLESWRCDVSGALSSTSWQGYLQTVAHIMRQIATQHARAFPLIATRHTAAPWLHPPLCSLEVVEHFLTTLKNHGFTDSQTVATYRAFSSFLLGHLLLESSTQGAQVSAMGIPSGEGEAQISQHRAELDLTGNSEIQRLCPMLTEDHSTEEFEAALETLLDRLEITLSQ